MDWSVEAGVDLGYFCYACDRDFPVGSPNSKPVVSRDTVSGAVISRRCAVCDSDLIEIHEEAGGVVVVDPPHGPREQEEEEAIPPPPPPPLPTLGSLLRQQQQQQISTSMLAQPQPQGGLAGGAIEGEGGNGNPPQTPQVTVRVQRMMVGPDGRIVTTTDESSPQNIEMSALRGLLGGAVGAGGGGGAMMVAGGGGDGSAGAPGRVVARSAVYRQGLDGSFQRVFRPGERRTTRRRLRQQQQTGREARAGGDIEGGEQEEEDEEDDLDPFSMLFGGLRRQGEGGGSQGGRGGRAGGFDAILQQLFDEATARGNRPEPVPSVVVDSLERFTFHERQPLPQSQQPQVAGITAGSDDAADVDASTAAVVAPSAATFPATPAAAAAAAAVPPGKQQHHPYDTTSRIRPRSEDGSSEDGGCCRPQREVKEQQEEDLDGGSIKTKNDNRQTSGKTSFAQRACSFVNSLFRRSNRSRGRMNTNNDSSSISSSDIHTTANENGTTRTATTTSVTENNHTAEKEEDEEPPSVTTTSRAENENENENEKEEDGRAEPEHANTPIPTNDHSSTCAVCQDDFAEGDSCIRLPCSHVFHTDCICKWFEMRNTCPECRHPLPTEEDLFKSEPDDE